MQKALLRVLVIDDSEDDTLLLERELKQGEWEITVFRVDTSEKMQQALSSNTWDVVISDYMIPGFGGMEALKLFNSFHLYIPFILISGKITEEMAVVALQDGAQDFVLKQNFARLLPAVRRGIEHVTILSEKRRTLESLAKSESELKMFRTLLDNSSDAIEVIEPSSMRFLDINDTDCRILGYTREEMLSMSVFDIDPVFNADSVKATEEKLRHTGSDHFESVHRRKDGSMFPVEVSTKLIELDKPYMLSIVRDITERKAAEETLRRANRALRTLSAGNEALIRAENEDTLLRSVTRVIVEQGSYSLAAVDYADENPQKSITPMAWSGLKEKDYWAKNLSWADTEQGQLPISKVIRTGMTQICRDIASEDGFNPYKDAARSHGYVSNIALPLSYEGKTFGALSIYSSISEPFDEEEVRLLEELANDLAYGIITLRARIEHEQHAIILRRSLEQSIQIIAATVEARDPYTAGHQRRVSELATAIAQEMGLSEEQIEGVHFAAIIHDLGKMHIPAEILSKPGKLSDMEFMFIHTHPQAGYDILKEVKFPWPIADIILQHHEKLDGSGYPQGLKGDQILLEAKIITVADVVEAMSSHRPYRSALGIEKALDEIRRGRGSEYDPSVVDTCLKLFTEKRFAFSNESL